MKADTLEELKELLSYGYLVESIQINEGYLIVKGRKKGQEQVSEILEKCIISDNTVSREINMLIANYLGLLTKNCDKKNISKT